MEHKADPLESLLETAEAYGKTSFDLLKLRAFEKTAEVTSSFITYLVISGTLLVFLLMMNTGIALWLGDLLGGSWYGFFAVAAFYGMGGILLLFFSRKWLKKSLGNLIIRLLFK